MTNESNNNTSNDEPKRLGPRLYFGRSSTPAASVKRYAHYHLEAEVCW